jgi:hypothetical protein
MRFSQCDMAQAQANIAEINRSQTDAAD